MTEAFIWDAGTPRERVASHAETQALVEEMDEVFRRTHTHLLYSHKARELEGGRGCAHCLRLHPRAASPPTPPHPPGTQWLPGDFIITDNAALGHEASPETQAPPSRVGLRVMHRTTVKGGPPPAKAYRIDEQGRRLPPHSHTTSGGGGGGAE